MFRANVMLDLSAMIHSHVSSTDWFEDAVVNQQCPKRWRLNSRVPAGIPTDEPIGVASPTRFEIRANEHIDRGQLQ
jgi:hypothetical protein